MRSQSTTPAYDDFAAWADEIFAGPIPPEVVAFGVNLSEGNDTFDAHLVWCVREQ